MTQARTELANQRERRSMTHVRIGALSGVDGPRPSVWGALQLPMQRIVIDATVAHVFGVPPRDLQGLSRGPARVAHARQVAMYLAHVVFSLSFSDTGRLFGRDRTTVSHACSVIEDRRDDATFDRVLELLESVILALIRPRVAREAMHN